ncbi:MAG: bacillithiol biosynthesis cysteine-adding enzyme BshC [Saprospiraceae bacterium]|nr:bacillithiol biosynthesis cysteine-adding enzyme BshC [Saprospiraceae bacterium]
MPRSCLIMHKTTLAFSSVPQLSKTDVAYAGADERLVPFYDYAPQMEVFDQILLDKNNRQYPRADLVATLQEQYRLLTSQLAVNQNIEALGFDNTFTIVTAHQPTLFTGPLYFVYKALTTIQLAKEVERRAKGKFRIVPVFVLGSEDHDLEEVNKANLFGKQLVWQPGASGPVGTMSTDSLGQVLEELKIILGESEPAQQLFRLVEGAYAGKPDFAAGTQALMHELLGAYGLVVLNMNDARLKKHFIPVIKAELMEQSSFRLVQENTAQLSALGFKPQATPREINLFYMKPSLRERIVFDGDRYLVLNTDLHFSKEELLAEVEQHPERFSPNVVLRPVYQEMILPNLAYVGGGGELAYWLERKTLFQHYGMKMPMLVRRHSLLWLDRDAVKKLHKSGFTAAEFFADTDALIRHFVSTHAEGEVSLESEINTLRQLYEQLAEKAKVIDPTLEKSLLAESVKAVAGMEHWQGRLVRAEKHKHEVAIQQIRALKEKLFPGGSLQERTDNVLPYLLRYGNAFFDAILEKIAPLEPGFVILEEEA